MIVWCVDDESDIDNEGEEDEDEESTDSDSDDDNDDDDDAENGDNAAKSTGRRGSHCSQRTRDAAAKKSPCSNVLHSQPPHSLQKVRLSSTDTRTLLFL